MPVNERGMTGFKVALVMRRPNNFVIEGEGASWRSAVIGQECGRVGSVRSRIGSDGELYNNDVTYWPRCLLFGFVWLCVFIRVTKKIHLIPKLVRVMRMKVGGSTEISG